MQCRCILAMKNCKSLRLETFLHTNYVLEWALTGVYHEQLVRVMEIQRGVVEHGLMILVALLLEFCQVLRGGWVLTVVWSLCWWSYSCPACLWIYCWEDFEGSAEHESSSYTHTQEQLFGSFCHQQDPNAHAVYIG